MSAGRAMREAVEELELDWSRRLGARRFTELKQRLRELEEVI